ncbi:lipid phosphate phosphatase, putative [Entamoeba nuttalli P19]|uniref:Lipid phosphate phosphatase, putative n=1 Tax=Entamoeba nuttalli (strain P19) TaxID=1076696 RepID=K2GV26_ENTNP|nr:lipid phosphate phosphatase, putative [Entamoeba nuttalli P19]EKE38958.1 lipid phosphate phosphatase, putative [Entamoeba nuttalli P19]|eukprot:XP_008858706.1 lipid phosphate phosphatase, putative [Entamoeba nuttalli P19]
MIIAFTNLRNFLYRTVTKSMPGVQKLQKKKNKFLDLFFYVMTHLAGVGVYIAFVPTAWWLHPSEDSIYISNALILLIAITTYIGNFMKNLFACPRPSGVWQPLKELDFGLPSTHTMNAVANGIFLIMYLKPVWWVCILITIYVIIVALSRIYMGVHSPADVIVGALLGFVSIGFYIVFPDIPREWYFIPFFFFTQVILLSLHSLCFSQYTPCYWRSVVGFGFVFMNYVMEVFERHKVVKNMPPYSCTIHYPFLLLKAFCIGFVISGTGYFIHLGLYSIFIKCPKLLDWYSSNANKIRFHCHHDPLEFTPEMNHQRMIYAVEFFSYYIGGFILATLCKVVSPIVIQYYLPDFDEDENIPKKSVKQQVEIKNVGFHIDPNEKVNIDTISHRFASLSLNPKDKDD